jgi:hypothetical protein
VVELLRPVVPASVLVVGIDPGKVSNRVWLTSGERGLLGEPVSLPVLREGIDTLAGLVTARGGGRTTNHCGGGDWPAASGLGGRAGTTLARVVRLFAPSETQAGEGAARLAALQDRRS